MASISFGNAGRSALAGVLVALALGCGPSRDYTPQEAIELPELRFSEVSVTYALRRVAGEAGLPLVVDEFRASSTVPDLSYHRIDLDIAKGTRTWDALDRIQRETGAFHFQFRDDLIYVRTAKAESNLTLLETAKMPPVTFDGTLNDLARWIVSAHQQTFMLMQYVPAQPIFKKVHFEVTAGMSPIDVILRFAQTAERGLLIRRAGYIAENAEEESYVATTVQYWGPLDSPRLLPANRNNSSLAKALGLLSKRLDEPMVVFDRSLLQDGRGSMDYSLKVDVPSTPAKEMVSGMAYAGENPDHYKLAEVDGVYRLRSRQFLSILDDRELLRAELSAGHFEGTLAEFARFLNAHLPETEPRRFAGGEITEGPPTAKLEISEGMTTEDALLAFARASGDSVYVVFLTLKDPLTGLDVSKPGDWRGAFLSRLADWTEDWDASMD